MIPLIIVFVLIPNIIAGGIVSQYAEKICTPTEIEPYYDCDEPTFIVIWDVLHPPQYNYTNDSFYINKTSTHLAAATYNIPHTPTVADNFSRYNVINFGYTYNETGLGKYDEPEVTVVAHEIRHIKCKCTWHPES